MKRLISEIAAVLTLAAAVVAGTLWAQEPAARGQSQPDNQAQSEPTHEAATTTFAGTIVKHGDKYMLRDTANKKTYMLEGADELKQYEGKNVTVIGSLNPDTNTIRVEKIEAPA